eukprot:5447616-Amphidinium_carterae.2
MAEKYLNTCCSKDHCHTRLEGGAKCRKLERFFSRLNSSLNYWLIWAIVKSIGKVMSIMLNESVLEPTFPVVCDLICPGCRGRKSALDPSHTPKTRDCRWADELEAMTKARAFVPRTLSTRASGLRDARRHPTAKKEPHTEVTSSKEHAAGT